MRARWVLCAALIAAPVLAQPVTTLALTERFEVSVDWQGRGAQGPGFAVPLSAESGTFWFFEPDNVEVLVKILDGRPVNGAHWLFATGLTDLETRLRVIDPLTGWSRVELGDRDRPLRVLDVGALTERRLGASVLWVGAHPDDEILVAPLLAEACAPPETDCTLLVLTRGEAGVCRLPGGCGDLGSLRVLEMRDAARALFSSLVQWTLPDLNDLAPPEIERRWGARRVADGLLAVLAERRVDTVVTFDPRHGSTGHPAHRALGEIVRRALAEMPSTGRPKAWALATTVASSGDEVRFGVHQRAGEPVDELAAVGDFGERWQSLLEIAAIHRSQFTPQRLRALEATPPEQRVVALTPLHRRPSLPSRRSAR